MTKILHMEIEACIDCPLAKHTTYKDHLEQKCGYFYCGHIDSPTDYVIVRNEDNEDFVLNFEQLEEVMPDWCPLPKKGINLCVED